MKILITYASAGAGHFKAAQALYNYFKENCRGIEINLVDVLEKSNAFFKLSYIWGYSFLIRRLVFLWRWAFWITDFRPLRPFTKAVAGYFNRLNTKGFAKFLIRENPDIIISAHFLSSEISANLKKTKKIKSKLVTVITDFDVHPFWVTEGTDIYCVACGFTKGQLIREGVDKNSIKECGIPVDAKFLRQYDRASLSRKFNIVPDKFTVLIVTGSFGIGPIEEITDLLYKEAQVLAVCANNKKLYKKLKDKDYPDCLVFGLIDNIEELMAVSDIIITKPGGLSIAESLAMDLLPIFISPIPGQERENINALRSYGIGIYPKNTCEIKNIVVNFIRHPEELKNRKALISRIKKQDTLKEICNVVCQSCLGLTC